MNFNYIFDLFYSSDYSNFEEWMSLEYEKKSDVELLFQLSGEQLKDQINSLNELIENYDGCWAEIHKMKHPHNKWLDNAIDGWDVSMKEDMQYRFRSIVEGMLELAKD